LPQYKKDEKKEINETELRKMMEKAPTTQKVAVALLYITGARPTELLALKKKDFIILEGELRIKLETLKRGWARILIFDRAETPFVNELIIPYVNRLKEEESDIFGFKTDARLRQIVYRLSNNTLTSYTFRHNRMAKLADLGMSPYELMAWKGSRTMDSVIPYVIRSGQTIEKFKNKIK
jgi:integrase